MHFETSDDLRRRSHEIIPGGSHTYAKGDDQYPALSPGFIRSGRGCRVRDADGNEFIEYGMGLRAVALGHAYPSVVQAVAAELEHGTNFNRPSPLEVACAEQFLSMVTTADMVKFAKDGSTVNSAAIRLARAHTGRDLVAICADSPFLATNDWFIGTTPMKAGIPAAVRELVLRFDYNDVGSLRRLFREHPDRIACVMLEVVRTVEPEPDFLAAVRDLCTHHGALLVIDEMITGFRLHAGGAHQLYGIEPDLSTFGKALANGFALSALAGRREIMKLGGIRHDRERVFLLSTTHGAETHALAAAIATMQVYKEHDVVGHMNRQGRRLAEGAHAAAARHGVAAHFEVVGKPANLVYATRDAQGAPSQAFRALFMQELIRNGVLAPSFVVSFSHGDEDIDRTAAAIDAALAPWPADRPTVAELADACDAAAGDG
jgi:glutamate-1-semialdehyde 2,1-aminomutase